MTADKTGTLIARAAGLVLIVMGASSLLYLLPWLQSSSMSAGWTSYSPPSTTTPTQNVLTQLHDTYYVVTSVAKFYIPSLAQIVAGGLMIFFSRRIGRWLAKGLNDSDSDRPESGL